MGRLGRPVDGARDRHGCRRHADGRGARSDALRRRVRPLPDRLDHPLGDVPLPAVGRGRRPRRHEAIRDRTLGRPPPAGAAHRFLVRGISRGGRRIRGAGGDHGGAPRGIGLPGTRGGVHRASGQHGARRLRRPRHADRHAGEGHRPRRARDLDARRTAASLLLAARAGLDGRRDGGLARTRRRLAGGARVRRFVRGPAVRDGQLRRCGARRCRGRSRQPRRDGRVPPLVAASRDLASRDRRRRDARGEPFGPRCRPGGRACGRHGSPDCVGLGALGPTVARRLRVGCAAGEGRPRGTRRARTAPRDRPRVPRARSRRPCREGAAGHPRTGRDRAGHLPVELALGRRHGHSRGGHRGRALAGHPVAARAHDLVRDVRPTRRVPSHDRRHARAGVRHAVFRHRRHARPGAHAHRHALSVLRTTARLARGRAHRLRHVEQRDVRQPAAGHRGAARARSAPHLHGQQHRRRDGKDDRRPEHRRCRRRDGRGAARGGDPAAGLSPLAGAGPARRGARVAAGGPARVDGATV